MKLKYQPTEQLKQTPHIVAFLDFLGASEKMRDPVKSNKFLQIVNAVYSLALSICDKIDENSNEKPKIKIFSDNIVVAKEIKQPDNPKNIFKTYQDVEQFSLMIYTAGMTTGNFIRGAISIGELCCNDVFVYGEGLLKSYNGESKNANYPRIIVDKDIFVKSCVDIWSTFNPPDEENIVLRDMDGELFLNPFYGIPKIAKDKESDVDKRLSFVGTHIVKEYKDMFAKNKKSVFPKYHWLANQFNEYCRANNHPFSINLDKLTFESKND